LLAHEARVGTLFIFIKLNLLSLESLIQQRSLTAWRDPVFLYYFIVLKHPSDKTQDSEVCVVLQPNIWWFIQRSKRSLKKVSGNSPMSGMTKPNQTDATIFYFF